ncbi:DUF2130 domain-containing protein [Bifidobacterium sp. W8101]|uniref:DUF2130 domain-containing protein n=1 Tax=Bifidobacterium TaxID=1678 RepID=UPI0018DB208E|nr:MULTISPECIES: DUF2130 domain-containing protein [Bifidobacterium]MBI0126405.1 DUF2130 domain-containing protein [Bifidobacterium choladohabitans]MBI0127974.1 DUF2130 domain-containing protein [Bifidobacterium sp. W8103]MBI0138562.1 DUF2130 domain-containing protein [Bifidobacterium sp. W8105]MBI0148468.1 DUF2130 domain-containing protein [Bifidobacterium sp. W8107]
MPEIICPKCGTAFTIDQAGYADILKQVRDKDFDRQLHERLEQTERENSKIRELDKAQAEQTLQKTKSAKDAQIQELQAKLESEQAAKELAVSEALRKVEKEKDDLSAKLDKAESEKQQALDLAEANSKSELQKAAADKEAEIVKLQNQLDAFELQKKQELAQALGPVEKERDDFKGRLERLQLEKESEEKLSKEQLKSQLQAVAADKDSEIAELKSSLDKAELQSKVEAKSLKERYEVQIQDRDEQIERLRDLKAKLSTKMVGETLEQHCQIEFNKLRSTAFPNAYFEKDNDARTGSKGDFIFRDKDDSGTEIVSIMFEMKNETDTTSTKHKNEDFFKELDKDRREKDCEYAIMVSLLEPDSDLYNTGIVDVSYRYPKMYVVRPQFFIPIITLLRDAAKNSLQYKNELEEVKAQNIDITHFEDELESFKSAFGRNYDIASKKFKTAVEEIDKSINHLNKIKDALLGSENQLRLANNKAQDVTIRRLTRNNETMKAKFDEVKKSKAIGS